jgi:hypothetical protein
MYEANKKGMAVIVSLGIVAVFTLLAASVTPVVVSSLRKTAELESSVNAYYAAEAGLQKGLYAVTHPEEVESMADTLDFGCGQGTEADDNNGSGGEDVCGAKANWKVFNTAGVGYKFVDGYYSYPIPGTGSAGETCDPYNPVVQSKSVLSGWNFSDQDGDTKCNAVLVDTKGNDYAWKKYMCELWQKGIISTDVNAGGADPLTYYGDPKDLPCNWNKIKYGETVQIPLYGASGKGLQFEEFVLKVRIPCKEGLEICGGAPGRYLLESYVLTSEELTKLPFDGSEFSESSSLLKNLIFGWGIEGGSCDGVNCFLSDISELTLSSDSDFYGDPNKPSFEHQSISLFTVQNLNSDPYFGYSLKGVLGDMGNAYGLLNSNISNYFSIYDFLTDDKNNFDQAYLKVSFIKDAKYFDENQLKSVPYLEYQLLYKATSGSPGVTGGIAVSNPLVVSEGFSNGYKYTLKARYNPKTGVVNYVVQQ